MPSKPQPAPPTTEIVQSAPIRPQSFMELERFATMAAKSDFVPKDYRGRPDNIMVAVQMGSELGLAPMQSLQNIAVINGRPALWGDAMLGLIMANHQFEDIQETIEGAADERTAKCVVRRRGKTPVVRSFSVANAKLAKLWGNNVWATYPDRMLAMRARGFALRDTFPDVLKGLIGAEEAQDSPQTIVGRAEEAPEPPPPPASPQKPADGAAPSHPTVDTGEQGKPQATPQKPAAGAQPSNGKVTLDTWLDRTKREIERTVSDAEAITVLRDRLAPWKSTQLAKLDAAEGWLSYCQTAHAGKAMQAYVTELLAERSRQENLAAEGAA